MRSSLVLLIILHLMGCGKGFKKETEGPISEEPISLSEDLDIGEEYEFETFSFTGSTVLKANKEVNAREIILDEYAEIRLGSYDLTLKAERIIFSEGSKITGYGKSNFADCRSSGVKSGDVYIYSKAIEGIGEFNLRGQNAGLVTSYYKIHRDGGKVNSNDSLQEFIHPFKQNLLTNFQCFFKSTISKDEALALSKPSSGGASGNVYIEAENLDNFNIKAASDVSLGSYEAWAYGSNGKWWYFDKNILKGPDGTPTQVCFLNEESSSCDLN